jgi:hypothetical protein
MSSPPNPFGQTPFSSGNPYQSPSGVGPQYTPPVQQTPILGILSLALGGLGLLLMCCAGPLALPFPLLAIGLGVFALLKSDSAGRALGIGGIVCGVISLAFLLVILVLTFQPMVGAQAPADEPMARPANRDSAASVRRQ